MCNLQIPNLRQEVKYPYSNLRKPHYRYLKLVDEFFKTMYSVNSYVRCEPDGIVIEIHDVCSNGKVYNPSSFDPSYKVKTLNSEITYITALDLFETFYCYISDIIPYLSFEFYCPYYYDDRFNEYSQVKSERYFDKFDIRGYYYDAERIINTKVYSRLTGNDFESRLYL